MPTVEVIASGQKKMAVVYARMFLFLLLLRQLILVPALTHNTNWEE
jgi:hypothetical protein